MGADSSKSGGRPSSSRNNPPYGGQQPQQQQGQYLPQPQQQQQRPPQQQQQQQQGRQIQQSTTTRFRAIADNFSSLEQVQEALRKEGLESSQLIVAVDFTKSNEWTGKRSFDGRSLHTIGAAPNPYEEVINILGRTLRAFDDDNLIPAYGFGDATTRDARVFSFLPANEPCNGLDEVMSRYRQVVPHVRLAGPTSFAPAIEQAVKVVIESGCQYHILLIVADGQVTRSSDLQVGQMSPQEQATVQAITAASQFPLSIVMVGVGDGPWDVMKEFDDALPQRQFDNFQFVNFTDTWMQYKSNPRKLETMFALRALMEVPEQFKVIQSLGMLSRPSNLRLQVTPLDPPGPPFVRGAMPGPGYPAPGQAGAYPQQGMAPQQAQYGAPPPQGAQSQYGTLPPLQGAQYAAAPGPPGKGAPPPMDADPSLYLCPITQEMMADPVIAADGYSYERSAIMAWLSNHNTSPMTNAALPHTALIPNHALRSSILEHRQRTGT